MIPCQNCNKIAYKCLFKYKEQILILYKCSCGWINNQALFNQIKKLAFDNQLKIISPQEAQKYLDK
jgi:lysyl-tRNA synthetase class I